MTMQGLVIFGPLYSHVVYKKIMIKLGRSYFIDVKKVIKIGK